MVRRFAKCQGVPALVAPRIPLRITGCFGVAFRVRLIPKPFFLPSEPREREREEEGREERKGTQVLALKGHPIRGSWFKRTLNTRSRWWPQF